MATDPTDEPNGIDDIDPVTSAAAAGGERSEAIDLADFEWLDESTGDAEGSDSLDAERYAAEPEADISDTEPDTSNAADAVDQDPTDSEDPHDNPSDTGNNEYDHTDDSDSDDTNTNTGDDANNSDYDDQDDGSGIGSAPAPVVPKQIWIRKLVAIVGVFVVVNLLAWAAGSVLSEPVTFATRGMQFQDRIIEERSRQGCVDLVVAGNSVSFQGISPTSLADQVGLESGLSVGIAASIATIDVDWMDRVALDRLDPSVVVWVASIGSFLPAEDVEGLIVSLYNRAPATSRSEGAALDRWLSPYVPLVRERPAITNFDAIIDQLEGNIPENAAEAFAAQPNYERDPDGHLRVDQTFDPRFAPLKALSTAFELVVPDWPVDTEQVVAISDYLAELEAQGITTVVVVPPATDELVSVLPGGAHNFARHADAAAQVAERAGSVLVDESQGAYDNEHFSDTHHLNITGAPILTAAVAEELGAVNPGGCG